MNNDAKGPTLGDLLRMGRDRAAAKVEKVIGDALADLAPELEPAKAEPEAKGDGETIETEGEEL